MSDAIDFLRRRIENGMPLYQGDVDAALAVARAQGRAEAAPPAALDVDPSTALAHWLCHGPEDKHTGDSMPCLPHYRMAHDFAARLTAEQEERHG